MCSRDQLMTSHIFSFDVTGISYFLLQGNFNWGPVTSSCQRIVGRSTICHFQAFPLKRTQRLFFQYLSQISKSITITLQRQSQTLKQTIILNSSGGRTPRISAISAIKYYLYCKKTFYWTQIVELLITTVIALIIQKLQSSSDMFL